MIKLNVIDMDEFLRNVNECAGAVKMIGADGKKRNITRQDEVQRELQRMYCDNHNYLKLALDIPNPKDYMKIVFFTIGDC